MEPRLGHHARQLGAARRHGLAHQLVAVVDHVAVVPLAELDLQQVVGHHGAVGLAAGQLLEALAGPSVASLGIVDVGLVVAGMVDVAAAAADAVEVVVGLVIAPLGEGDVAHPHVVLLAARAVERLVVGPFEAVAGPFEIGLRAVVGAQREAHVVGEDRARVALLEVQQRRFGIAAAQLDGAGRQVVVDALEGVVVGRGNPLARLEEFEPGVAPTAVVEEFAAALEGGQSLGCRRLRLHPRKGAQQQRPNQFSAHSIRFWAKPPCRMRLRKRRAAGFAKDGSKIILFGHPHTIGERLLPAMER